MSYINWLLESLLARWITLQQYLLSLFHSCQVVVHTLLSSWKSKHFYNNTASSSANKGNMSTLAEDWDPLERYYRSSKCDEQVKVDDDCKETSTHLCNTEKVVQIDNIQKDNNKELLHSYLLEAKRNIEFCLAEMSNQGGSLKSEPLQTSNTEEAKAAVANAKKEQGRFLRLSPDVLIRCEMIAGRIAMPALMLCFLREYFEPGHPMLTSQILSLLPLQVYGDIAPSGYNPYITYISGLLKTETQTRVSEIIHVVFNLVLSSLFAKLNIATNILKIILGT